MNASTDTTHDGDALVLLLADCHRKLEESKRRADIKLGKLSKLRTVRKAADGLRIKPSSVMRRVQSQYNSRLGQLNEILGETLTIREEVTSMRSDRIALQTAIKRLRSDLDQHQQEPTMSYDVQPVGESDGAGTAAGDAKRSGGQSSVLADRSHGQSLDASNPDFYDSDEAPSPSKKRHHAPAHLRHGTSLAFTPPPIKTTTGSSGTSGSGIGSGSGERALASSQSSLPMGRTQPEGQGRERRGGGGGARDSHLGSRRSSPSPSSSRTASRVGFQTGTGAASRGGLHRTILQAVQDPRAIPPGLQKSIEATDIKLTGGLGMKLETGQQQQHQHHGTRAGRRAVDQAVPSPRTRTSTSPVHALPRLVSGAGAHSLPPRSTTSASSSSLSSSSSSAAARARRLIMGALHAGTGVERKSGESLDLDVTRALARSSTHVTSAPARSSTQRGTHQQQLCEHPPDEAGFAAQLGSPPRRQATGARGGGGQQGIRRTRRADAHARCPRPRPPDESVARVAVARTMRSPVVARWVRAREQPTAPGGDPGSREQSTAPGGDPGSSSRGAQAQAQAGAGAEVQSKTPGLESESRVGETVSGVVDGTGRQGWAAKTKTGPGQWAADVDAAALQQARRDVEQLRQAARGLELALQVARGTGTMGAGAAIGHHWQGEASSSSAASSAAESPAARSRRASWDGQLGGNRAHTLLQREATHLGAGSEHRDGQKGAPPDALAGVPIDASSLQEASSLLEEHQRLASSVGALWENVMSVAKSCCGV